MAIEEIYLARPALPALVNVPVPATCPTARSRPYVVSEPLRFFRAQARARGVFTGAPVVIRAEDT